MKSEDIKNLEIKTSILKLLQEKAPNSVRIVKVYEVLSDQKYEEKEIDQAIEDLIKEKKIKKSERFDNKTPEVILDEVKRRTSIALYEYRKGMPIKGDYQIGDKKVIRMLSLDRLSGEDINEITEALKDYIDNIDKTFDERVRKETAKIYRQMIGIFGVFVSIFAIIIISTDKMLRFSPKVLDKGWLSLLGQSIALFLPVGVVIALLVFVVMRNTRK